MEGKHRKDGKNILILLTFLLLAGASAAITGAQVVDPFVRLVCELFSKYYVPLALAVLMLAYAGAKWIYAQDDDEQRMIAKDIVVYILAGVLVLVIAKELINVLFGFYICT